MDFLNKAFAQITDLFRSMTPAARITSALLLGVIVLSVGYLFNRQTSGPNDYLMNGQPIEARQLPAVEAAFAKAGLNDYKFEGLRVRVPQGQKNKYMAALADGNALPKSFGTIMENSLSQTGPFTNSKTQKQLYRIAKQQELSQIIQMMDGIAFAAVMYDVAEKRGLGKRGDTITASVNVQPSGNRPLSDEKVDALRNLVASAIAGLDADDVSIQDLSTGISHTVGKDEGGLGRPKDDPYASRKRYYERDWSSRVHETLKYVPGVVVVANVELNPHLRNRQQETSLKPTEQVALKRTEVIETNTTQGGGPAGRVGVAAQGGAGGPAGGAAKVGVASTGRRTESETSKLDETSDVGRTVQDIETAGLTPKRVKVAVGVPSTYIDKIWRKKNPVKEGESPVEPTDVQLGQVRDEVVEKLNRHVKSLIPQERDAQDTRLDVTVTVFDDVAQKVVIEEPDTADHAMLWFGQNWSKMGLGFLAFVSLLTLRSMVKSAPAAERVDQPRAPEEGDVLPFAPQGGADFTVGDEEEMEVRVKRKFKTGPSLRDELGDMVREDPDTAAAILKTWIANAG